ncbi:hypothetical protein LOC68_16385 [Blastopirellula sp. JC732]|uniref:Uncharacterized protein n=1 Tax=Blastopirellula sediminis TaxID=2894196 RepID=A0A9X1MNT0_9BACT|nr:hypothetical protein [Blastopirellula sediminis]MCC9606732.1 hypothetical protein [Blastopirellula sediminis]MCC9629971.1 hypothetical protein [Blastopirellula sediminis]
MSEYQFVAFRAIDVPVCDKNMSFMEKQSTRAEITPWSFENEYHYGDFRGDADEMLRRGYDIHLYYANFGIRRIAIRFSQPPPVVNQGKEYLDGEALRFVFDKKGTGGILFIEPQYEPGWLDDYFGDLGELLDRLRPLRDEIAAGDLRPLYLAALAVRIDMEHDPDEETEPPVPAGMKKLTDAQRALAELYEISDYVIDAAAQVSATPPKSADLASDYERWLADQKSTQKDQWLHQVMCGKGAEVRREMLKHYRASTDVVVWPTIESSRTMKELHDEANKLYDAYQKRAAKKREASLLKRRVDMAADPKPTLQLIDKLVAERSSKSYRQAAELLGELRTALAQSRQASLAQNHALKLVKANPTLNILKAELKRRDFLTK